MGGLVQCIGQVIISLYLYICERNPLSCDLFSPCLMLRRFPSSWEISNNKKKLVLSGARERPCKMSVAAKGNKGAWRGPGGEKEAKLIRHGCEEQSGTGVHASPKQTEETINISSMDRLAHTEQPSYKHVPRRYSGFAPYQELQRTTTTRLSSCLQILPQWGRNSAALDCWE